MTMTIPANSFYFDWEIRLMEYLQAHITGPAMDLVSCLSVFGEELLMIAVMGFLYWCYDKDLGRFIGLQIIMACVWNPMIKNIFLRRRPYFESDGIELLRKIDREADVYDIAAQGYSFPSFHSSGAMTLYGSIARQAKKRALTWAAVVLPLLTGFSRICVGAHYPTDVLAGLLLGLFTIFFVPWLERKIGNRRVFLTVLILTALPGFFYCTSTDYFSALGLLIGYALAMPFEERYVRFQNTRSPVRSLFRVAGGGIGYIVLNSLFKLPFSKDFLASPTAAAHLVRTLRYALVIFLLLGVYPLAFDRLGKSQKEQAP